MRSQAIVQHKTNQDHSRRAIPTLRQGLIGLYAIFLGLVLPFVCWGALAQPGHTHGKSHFVFAVDPHIEMGAVDLIDDNSNEHAPTVSGKSMADTFVTLALFSVIIALWWFFNPQRNAVRRVKDLMILSPCSFAPPTPPPRAA
jgi:hypothetical protein